MIIVAVTGDKVRISSGETEDGSKKVEVSFNNHQWAGEGKTGSAPGVPVEVQAAAIRAAAEM